MLTATPPVPDVGPRVPPRWEATLRRLRAVGWSACAVAAAVLAAVTSLPAHRCWGVCAAAGYGAAAVLTLAHGHGRRWLPGAAATVGAVVLPLAVLVATGVRQPEVGVVERAALSLLRTGSPYAAHAPGSGVDSRDPYLPGMAVFGLPRAVPGAGVVGDARWWLAAAFLLTGAATAAVALRGRTVAARRYVSTLACCPLLALPTAVGGDDLPVIGLSGLALACADAGRDRATGLALGAAAALKWSAWPAVPVALVLLGVRHGRRAAVRAGAVAAALVAAVVVPAVVAAPRRFAGDAVAFPLGLSDTPSPAASPLPGRLLAMLAGGPWPALVLLAAAAAAMAVSLAARPPRTLAAACVRLALGLTLATLLMPATRVGYLAYPAALLLLARAATASPEPSPAPCPPRPAGTTVAGGGRCTRLRLGVAMADKPRIGYVPLDAMDDRMRAEMDRCAREGTPRPESQAVRAHVPAAFWAFADSWQALFREGVCDHATKELCRVYVSRSVRCEYCGNQRSVRAHAQGLREREYDDLLEFESSERYDERQKAALAYAEAITWHLDVDDAFWDRLHAHFTEPELVELGNFVALTMGQQSWLRLIDIDHHQYLAGTSASMAPGFETAESAARSKASADYWAAARST